MMSQGSVLIMAGGTGGHIFPALAVAQNLQEKNIPVVWLGTRRGLEAQIVADAGIPIAWISVRGLRGKGLLKIIFSPVSLTWACIQAFFIILKIKPKVVLGMGGFVSGPGALVARFLGKPLIIHEQNAVAGFTNKMLSRIANIVLEAFPTTFSESRMPLCIGNPVRQDILNLPKPEVRLAARKAPLNILVLGGSQGARALNDIMPKAIKTIPIGLRPRILHQAGKVTNVEEILNNYLQLNVKAEVQVFIRNMAEAYAWSDLVVCRAGAMTIAEIAAAGVASVLVPFPHAVDDHQTANARYLSEANAAILIQQSALSDEKLGDLISALSVDRERILQMAIKARRLGKPGATEALVNQCLMLADGFTDV